MDTEAEEDSASAETKAGEEKMRTDAVDFMQNARRLYLKLPLTRLQRVNYSHKEDIFKLPTGHKYYL